MGMLDGEKVRSTSGECQRWQSKECDLRADQNKDGVTQWTRISICRQSTPVAPIDPKLCTGGLLTCWIQICYQICSLTNPEIQAWWQWSIYPIARNIRMTSRAKDSYQWTLVKPRWVSVLTLWRLSPFKMVQIRPTSGQDSKRNLVSFSWQLRKQMQMTKSR